MKVIKKYFKKRKDAISILLEKPKQLYTPATFHKLRVEIKKLNALFELINSCSKDFKREKTFKPFKLIFRQAGKVRELHVEEAMLKKYFLNHLLNNYRNNLKKLRLKEQENYFSIVNKKFVSELKKKYSDIEPFLAQMEKKKINSYMEKNRNKIKKLLSQHPLQRPHVHALRKQLKKYNCNLKSLKMDKQNNPVAKKDALTELPGKWHDCQVIIRHLQKAIDSGEINSKEKRQLEKIKTKISSESEMLFNKINAAILESEFFAD